MRRSNHFIYLYFLYFFTSSFIFTSLSLSYFFFIIALTLEEEQSLHTFFVSFLHTRVHSPSFILTTIRVSRGGVLNPNTIRSRDITVSYIYIHYLSSPSLSLSPPSE